MKRLSQLDGMRGLAVAAVVLHHLSNILNLDLSNRVNIAVLDFFHLGWLGVDIFFVLSGFLITGIILKERQQPCFWRNFYLRRAYRILPIFTVVFAVTIFAVHYFSPQTRITSGYVLAVIFFLANWTVFSPHHLPILQHLWSLAVEEQFYFLWPQVAKRWTKPAVLRLAVFMALMSECLRLVFAMQHRGSGYVLRMTPTRLDGISVGAALAVSLTMPATRQFLFRWWRSIAISAAIAFLVACTIMHGRLVDDNNWGQVLGIPPVIVLTAMMIYGASESLLSSGIAYVLNHPILTYLGRRSYALYLIHEPIRYSVQQSRMQGRLAALPGGVAMNWLFFGCVLLVSLLLAELSWRLIESPAQNLRRRQMKSNEESARENPSEEKAIAQLATGGTLHPPNS